jgi:hypothetical protein
MEDTTQETVVETPVEDKVEATETTGVEQEVTTDDAQTPVDKEAQAEEEAEESLFKELMEKKGFKSEKDLAKAYSELEGSFSKKSADAAELEKLVDAILTADDDTDDASTNNESEKTQRLEADMNLMKATQRHPDLPDFADKMKEIAEKNPDAKGLFRTADGVELLYKMAKVDNQDDIVAKAKEEGRNEVTAKEVEKLQATVASDTKAKRPDKKVFTRAEIRDMSDEEYDKYEAEIKAQAAAGLIE